MKGLARIDRKTKNLTKRIKAGEIAVIDHPELDDVAAKSLVQLKVKAVINASPSLSDKYPNPGPLTLLKAKIPLLDNVGTEIMDLLTEGEFIEIKGNTVCRQKQVIAQGKILTEEEIRKHMEFTQSHMQQVTADFVMNTLTYAKNEVGLINNEYELPPLKTVFKKRHVLIVVRGENYKEDLNAIKSYIDDVKPILIGVDGGADALQEFGYKPDLIMGDMDSVTDNLLKSGAELVVHAYKNGQAPGLERIQKLGLEAHIFKSTGTSEDIAMLIAYDLGAELIVAVGSHSNIQDFLEKGRKGMASTFLVRMKVGSKLVDAKGASKIYNRPLKISYLVQVILAALLPVLAVMILTPSCQHLFHLLFIHLKLLFS